jgi:hypothetical protein
MLIYFVGKHSELAFIHAFVIRSDPSEHNQLFTHPSIGHSGSYPSVSRFRRAGPAGLADSGRAGTSDGPADVALSEQVITYTISEISAGGFVKISGFTICGLFRARQRLEQRQRHIPRGSPGDAICGSTASPDEQRYI